MGGDECRGAWDVGWELLGGEGVEFVRGGSLCTEGLGGRALGDLSGLPLSQASGRPR